MNIIKKSLSILIILCLLMASTFNTLAITNNEPDSSVIWGFSVPPTVYIGETFDTIVTLHNTTTKSIVSFLIDVIYDNTKLKLNSAAPISMTAGQFNDGDFNLNLSPNSARFFFDSYFNGSPIPPTATNIFKISFTVINDTTLTTANFSFNKLEVYELVNSNLATIPSTSTPASTTIAISTPTALTASPSYDSINLSWNTVIGATNYEIYKLNATTNSYENIANTSSLSYINQPLQPGEKYYYKIIAKRVVGNDKIESNYTEEVSATAEVSIPASFKATSNTSNSIKLTWKACFGVSGYEIYKLNETTNTYDYLATTSSLSYIATSLKTGTKYYFKINAYAMINSEKFIGNYSSPVLVTPVPLTPTNLKAISTSYNSIKLTWSASVGATNYTIYRSISNSNSYKFFINTSLLNYTNINLATGTTYYYKIYAYMMNGTAKICSLTTSQVFAKPIPSTPTAFTVARASSTSLKISCSAVAGATGYTIYRSTSLTGTFTYLTSTTKTSYINTGLTKNKSYYYKLYAYRLVNGAKACSPFTTIKSAKPY